MRWTISPPRSLKARMTLFVLAIVLIVILALMLHAARVLRGNMQRLLSDQQLSIVTLLARSIDEELDLRVRALEVVADAIDVAMLDNPANLQAFLRQHVIMPILFNQGVHVVGRDGVTVADVSDVQRIGRSYAGNDAVHAVLQEKKKHHIGRPSMDLLNRPIFPIAVALRDTGGNVIGAMVGTTNLGKPNFLDTITQGRYGKTGDYLILSLPHRLVVTSSDKSRIMEALPGTGVNPVVDHFLQGNQHPDAFVNLRGVEVLASGQRIPVANWSLVMALPTDEAFAPIRAMQQDMLLATLYFTLLAGALMWWMLRHQLAPMMAAAGMLTAQAESDQGLQPLPVVRSDEIGQLIGGFNHLLEALGQREMALQESEKRYRILVETSSAMIWSVDLDGRWTFVNQVVKSIYGYTPEEMLGRLFTDFELPGQAQKDLDIFVKVKAGERAMQYKTSHLRKDGTLVILNFNAVAMHDGAGNVIGTSGTATDITTLVRSEAAKQESMARLRLVTEQLSVSLWTTDEELRILTCSGTGLLAAGLQREQVIGNTLHECYSFDQELIAKAQLVLASKEGMSMEEIGVGGHVFMCRIEPSLDAEGQLIGLMGMSFDITEQKGYQEAMFAEKERTQVTLHSIGDGVIAADIEGRVTYLNPAAEKLTGWGMAEAVGVPLLDVFQVHDEASGDIMFDPMSTVIQQAKTSKSSGAVILRRRDSSTLSIQDHCAPIIGRDGKVIGMVLTFQDISESQKMAAQLAFQGTHDALTKLPNRILLGDRLTQAIAQAERKHEQIALMFLDLDRFKNINDTLGHAVGDSLLQLIAQRLTACVRKMDTVCRLGGDEFVILLTVAWPGRVLDVTRKIFDALMNPYLIGPHTINITSSMGIAVYPGDGTCFDELSRHADLAMYHAKEQGRNNYQFYREEMNARVIARQEIENDLRRALDEGELEIHYQPQMNLGSGLLVGAEALLRWRDPERGLVLPGEFITIAEECGLILPIGQWVLNEVCRQSRAWKDAGLTEIKIAVNCSALQFRDPTLLTTVKDVLSRHQISPAQLELELAENIAMHDAETGILVLHALKEIGVKLAIDDFGTGYSSLSYLKRFPVDSLKIDHSFVLDITTSSDAAAISQTIMGIGHSLHLGIIAEGVENIETLNFLREHQCDEMQGNYVSRPLPAVEFEQFMRKLVGTCSAP